MAVVECNALSVCLSGSFSATMVVPENADMAGEASHKYPALYLLHDLGEDDSFAWKIKNLETLASRYGVFIIAPSVHHSFALDLRYGAKYGKFIGEELPGICNHLYPLSEDRMSIGGIGWGAYGALMQYLSPGSRFQHCLLVNGRFDLAGLYSDALEGKAPQITGAMMDAVFGNEQAVSNRPFDVYQKQYAKELQVLIGCVENHSAARDSVRLGAVMNRDILRGATEESIMEQAISRMVF